MPEGLVGLRNDCAVGGGSEAGEASGGVFTYHSLLFSNSSPKHFRGTSGATTLSNSCWRQFSAEF
jgi:hypothetical protein